MINPLVGRKVETWYPDHGGWYPGIITDYNITNDKHWCDPGRGRTAHTGARGSTGGGYVNCMPERALCW